MVVNDCIRAEGTRGENNGKKSRAIIITIILVFIAALCALHAGGGGCANIAAEGSHVRHTPEDGNRWVDSMYADYYPVVTMHGCSWFLLWCSLRPPARPFDLLGQSRECGDGSDSEQGTFLLNEHDGSESPMLDVPHTGLSSAAYCEQRPEEPKYVGSLSW